MTTTMTTTEYAFTYEKLERSSTTYCQVGDVTEIYAICADLNDYVDVEDYAAFELILSTETNLPESFVAAITQHYDDVSETGLPVWEVNILLDQEEGTWFPIYIISEDLKPGLYSAWIEVDPSELTA